MRLIDVPFTLTVVLVSFLCGFGSSAAVFVLLPRFERLHRWLAIHRGGNELTCLRCGKRAIRAHLVGSWHLLPRGWLSNTRTGALACSLACARAAGDIAVDERLRKVHEVVDVMRWATGTLPPGEGQWIVVEPSE